MTALAHRPAADALRLKARIRARRNRLAGTYLVEVRRPGRRAYHEVSPARFRAFEEQLRTRGHVSGTWGSQKLDLFLWSP